MPVSLQRVVLGPLERITEGRSRKPVAIVEVAVPAEDSICNPLQHVLDLDLLSVVELVLEVEDGEETGVMTSLKRAYQQDARWAELLTRLPASELLKDDDAMVARLLNGMKETR